MTTDRPNRVLAADVELALILLKYLGLRATAAFLAGRGADFELTCRVLAEPARRRQAATTEARATPGAHNHLPSSA